MTTALIKKMKNTLGLDRHLLRELADTSRAEENMTEITILTDEQKKNALFTETSGVDINKLTKYLCETFGNDYEVPVKLDIYPLMLQQLCHNNSRMFARTFKMDVCVGFNITACECGEFMSFEIHSLPVDKEGKFYDITEDFYGEKQKWFLPITTIKNDKLKCDNLNKLRIVINNYGQGFFYSQREHYCPKAKCVDGRLKIYSVPEVIEYPITKKKDVREMIRLCKML